MVSIHVPAEESHLSLSVRTVLLSREAITLPDLAARLRIAPHRIQQFLDEWVVQEKVECLHPVNGRRKEPATAPQGCEPVFYRWRRAHDRSQLWQLKYARNPGKSLRPRTEDYRAIFD